jgi:POT family proton-dependent oligopeptide transporter
MNPDSPDRAEAPETEARPSPPSNRWPPQIKYIVGNEACERFSYYGMKSILAGYITGKVLEGGLGQLDDRATILIHLFVFVNYFMPLFGGWLSDRLIGRYNTILWVSLFYCAGHGVLACSDYAGHLGGVHAKLVCLCVGLGLIAFGSGGIKPCVSAFMGDQFKPEQSHLIQKAYGAFYWSINLGSFFSFLVIPWIKDRHHVEQGHYNFSPAFAVPGLLMALATFIFWLGRKKYMRVPPSRHAKRAGFLKVFFAAWRGWMAAGGSPLVPLASFLSTIGLPLLAIATMAYFALWGNPRQPLSRAIGIIGLGCVGIWYTSVLVTSLLGKLDLGERYWNSARGVCKDDEIGASRTVSPILYIFALIPIFFSLFDQTNSTWVLQGKKMIPCVFHVSLPTVDGIGNWVHHATSSPIERVEFSIGAETMQSVNPFMIMVLVPLLTMVVYPRIGRWASPLKRMTLGMFLAAVSYVAVALIQARIEAGAQLSVLWQNVPYFILTAAEVFTSTTGLEFAFRESAPEMKSTVMSFWLVAISFGDLLVAGITKLFSSSDPNAGAASVTSGRFLVYAGLTFVVGILFSIVATKYQYRDKEAELGR